MKTWFKTTLLLCVYHAIACVLRPLELAATHLDMWRDQIATKLILAGDLVLGHIEPHTADVGTAKLIVRGTRGCGVTRAHKRRKP